MHYVTATDLLDRFDARELAQTATPPSMTTPDDEVMAAVIRGEATGGFDPEQVAAAEATLVVIDEAIDDAEQLVDGYVGQQHNLPLDPVPKMLRRLSGDIARYHLHDDDPSDTIRQRYEDALKILKAIADDEISLGADQPTESKAGSAHIEPTETRWRRDRADGYV